MKLAILDRDGVINHDSKEYILSPEQWQPIPGSLNAIARLNQAGFHIVVASNQSALARGLLDIETLNTIHAKMNAKLAEHGARIDAIFFCPHQPKQHCQCRKPATGLYDSIAKRLRISLSGVPCIGDKATDLDAALAVQGRPFLVRTGHGKEIKKPPASVTVCADLAAAADILCT
ncbi:MAG: D-glycero-beta-D-manno-heptose 1,7-bisphosphate 7-phosphatase [Candidatus Eutrophobiaceae bacterium]